MKTARTITVAISPEMRAFIGGRIEVGRYGNASEVVRAALRLLEEREDANAPQTRRVVRPGRDN